MNKLIELIQYIQNIQSEQILDIIIAICIFILFKIFSSGISYIIIKIFNMKQKEKRIKEHGLYKPIKYAVILLGAHIAITCLGLKAETMALIIKIEKSILIAIIANGLSNMLTPKAQIMKRIKKSNHINANEKVSSFIGKLIRYVIYIIAGFMIAYEFGYNLSGIITGLGLGSVVLALAAQDIAKNLCSGVVLLFDKPFIVGDFIQVAEHTGTVEDITFRAVRMKTLDNTLVTIPNSKISEGAIINYSKIENRRYECDLLITLETSIQKIEEITQKIKDLLRNNRFIKSESVEVQFNKIESNGININIFCYTATSDYIEFLKIEDIINKQLMQLLNKENVELAYDTKTIYIQK